MSRLFRRLGLMLSMALAAPLLVPSTALAQSGPAQNDRWLDIELGKSVVIAMPKGASAIAVTDPEVADYVVLGAATRIQVQGKQVGSTDLVFQFGPDAEPLTYEITVHQDLSGLVRQIDAVVDGPTPRVYPINGRIVIEGDVPDLITLEKVTQLGRLYDEEFVDLMTVRGDHQVQVEIIFSEVSRTALREVGLNLSYGNDELSVGLEGPSSSAGLDNPLGDSSGMSNPFIQSMGYPAAGLFQILGFVDDLNLAAVLSVLDDHKLTKTLARPTQVALSGQQGEMLVGGEVPVPVNNNNGRISIAFKEYGVKMVFVPTVLAGDLIDVRAYVEVSDVDFSVSSRITGIEIPGFVSRKMESHLRLEDGMTFAMSGLLSRSTTHTRSEVPLLGRIPVLGALFRYQRHEQQETELLVFVTPRLVRPMSAEEIPPLPTDAEDNNPNDLELFFLGMDHRAQSRSLKPSGEVGMER